MDSYTNERQREVQELFSEFWRVYRTRILPYKPFWRGGVPSARKASGISCCSAERAVRIRGGSADPRRASVRARRRRGVVHLLAHGGVADLAYAGDLKSSAFGIVGSSPTAPTMRVALDAPLKLQCTWATSMHLRKLGAPEKLRCTWRPCRAAFLVDRCTEFFQVL